jgi:5,6-dimethylbenzimidazole synthase
MAARSDPTSAPVSGDSPAPVSDDSRAPVFGDAFLSAFEQLLVWRRDVRRFRPDPLPDGLVDRLLGEAMLGPSVGNAQPWRWVIVTDPDRRARIRADFEACNADALAGYSGDTAKLYAGLKLAGLDDAPVHIAAFVDHGTGRGAGLGRKTMPEMLAYSVVGAIQILWLSARARGVGLGWVSILTPETVARVLDVPDDWALVGYLCLGYPLEDHADPELERAGWQARADATGFIHRR